MRAVILLSGQKAKCGIFFFLGHQWEEFPHTGNENHLRKAEVLEMFLKTKRQFSLIKQHLDMPTPLQVLYKQFFFAEA